MTWRQNAWTFLTSTGLLRSSPGIVPMAPGIVRRPGALRRSLQKSHNVVWRVRVNATCYQFCRNPCGNQYGYTHFSNIHRTFFTVTATRGHPYKCKLCKHHNSSNDWAFFTERVINIWNKLSTPTVDFNSLSSFRKQLATLISQNL